MTPIKALLDKVYELEGLLQLALSRNDEASARISALIVSKGEAVAESLQAYRDSLSEEALPSDEENPLAEAEDLMSYSIEEEEEDASADDGRIDTPLNDNPGDEVAESVEEEVAGLAYGPETEIDSESEADSEQETDSESVVPSEPETPAGPEKTVSSRRLKSLFSINDRFRFSRELFGGSTRRFDDSLAYLDTALDYNEVEDFFITEQGFDPESPVVVEFLEILSRSFAS